MVKSRLPREIEVRLPSEILHVIYTFLPHNPRPSTPSPQLQRELQKLQNGGKKSAMYLKGLEDFVLD